MMIEQLERNAVKWIAKLSPWLASIPSAYFVARASIKHLSLPLPIAIVIAVVIETLGLSTMYTRLWLANWNGSKLQSDRIAPTSIATILVAVYFATTIMLIVVLDVYPPAATIAPALFPLLAVVGTMNLVLIAQQEQREHQAEADKAARKATRAQAKHVIAELEQPRTPEQHATRFSSFTCWCGYESSNGNGIKSRAAHIRKHYNEIKQAGSAVEAELILEGMYPNSTTPESKIVHAMWDKTRKVTV